MGLTIAQFTFGLQLAGQERVVVDLARAFHETGHRSLVCTMLFGGELVKELEASAIPYQCMGLKRSYDPRAIIPVIRYLRANKVNVVITHGSSGSSIPRMAAIIARIPVFIHVEHSISEHKNIAHILFNKFISVFVDKIVCVSQSARKSLLKIEKTSVDKAVVIHNGIDTGRLKLKCEESKDPRKIRRIGTVGRFFEEKGHIYFIDAAVKIVESCKDVEFVFIGDGPLRQTVEQKVRACGIANYCKFLGVRSDVHELLQTLDIFALPSLREGLPISLLEAQYFGIPSVVTDVGGNGEVIVDGCNGLLVPPRDPISMANAILKLLSDDYLHKAIGQTGRKVFFRKFTADKMAQAYLDLASDILDRKRTKDS